MTLFLVIFYEGLIEQQFGHDEDGCSLSLTVDVVIWHLVPQTPTYKFARNELLRHLVNHLLLILPITFTALLETVNDDGLSQVEFGCKGLQNKDLWLGVHHSVCLLH